MEAYKRWVRQNKDFVHSLESLTNWMTWLLPERFSDSEIGPEAVTTIFGIITAMNEHIIDTDPAQTTAGSVEPKSFPYPFWLSSIKELETLIEVVAEQYYGDDKKWNFLAVMEAIKVMLRLSLFWKSGYKMLLLGGEMPNDDKNSDNFTSQRQKGHLPQPRGHLGSGYMNNSLVQRPGNLEGKALSALSKFGENARVLSDPTWLRRVKHQHEIMMPPVVERPSLLTVMSKKGLHGVMFLIGEFLFITRPLIYVLFIRKYGIRSWTPWFMSFGIDCIRTGVLSVATASVVGGKEKAIQLTASEKDEVRRRRMLFVLYLVRDPFFSKYTRLKLERTGKILEPVPIIGILTEKVIELMIGAQTRYSYTSGS